MQGITSRKRGRPRGSSSEGGGTVQALDRGLMILNALAKEGEATLTELSMKVGLPASSVHRLLMTLEKHGFSDFHDESQHWTIGVEAFRVGSTFLQRAKVVEAGREVMRALLDETGETVNIAIADQGDVVFVSQVETHQPIRAFFRLGTRGHMHASGIGKALMAEMSKDEVEQLLVRKGLPEFTPTEERTRGMRCVASAIYNEFGEAIAGVSVSGPTVRMTDNEVARIWPKVQNAAAQITELMGGRRKP
ncbi:MAG: IclR family transcriptional regulator [Limibacillus sp.]